MHDASHPPEPEALSACLGKAAPFWEAVIGLTRERVPHLAETWHFAGPKIGWSLRLVEKDRILVYLTPGENHFRVGLVLGKKAVTAAREAGLSKAASALLDAAPTYAEGHGVRFQVASRADMEGFQELLAIKVSAPSKRRPRGKPKS